MNFSEFSKKSKKIQENIFSKSALNRTENRKVRNAARKKEARRNKIQKASDTQFKNSPNFHKENRIY